MTGVKIVRAREIDGVVGDDVRAYVVGHLARHQGFQHVDSHDVEIGVAGYPEAGVDTPHLHPTVTEAQLVLAGRVELRLLADGAEHVLHPGDFYLVEPGTAHVQKASRGTRVAIVKWPSLDDKTIVEPDDETRAWMDEPVAGEEPPARRRGWWRRLEIGRWVRNVIRGTGIRSYQWHVAGKRAWIVTVSTCTLLVTFVPVVISVPVAWGWYLASGALVGCVAGIHAATRLVDRRFSITSSRDVRVVVGSFWDVVASVDGERTAIAFGVHDRLTAGELRPRSLHAEFRRYHLGSVVGEGGVPIEIACARALGKDARVPGADEERWAFGTVVPVPYVGAGPSARRAYLLVNSTLGLSEGIGVPHRFNGISATGEDAAASAGPRRLFEAVRDDSYPAETLVVPLLGTGYAARATPTGAIFHLVDAYIDALLEDGASARVRHLVISLHHTQVTEGNVDLRAVHKYVEARLAVHARMV